MLYSTNSLLKNLKKTKKKNFGRNNSGKITVRHRGGGLKAKSTIIDYNRFLWNTTGIILSIEKTKFVSAYLAAVVYSSGILSYILAPDNLKIGSKIIAGNNIPIKEGNNTFLKNIPLNQKIHNIEAFPMSGGKYVRSAGTWATIIEQKKNYSIVCFKNGKKKKFSSNCCATIGGISNPNHKSLNFFSKAGDSRKIGKRPKVRGVAMNATDHPHGGGKGKKSPPNPNYNFIKKLPKGRKTSKRRV